MFAKLFGHMNVGFKNSSTGKSTEHVHFVSIIFLVKVVITCKIRAQKVQLVRTFGHQLYTIYDKKFYT